MRRRAGRRAQRRPRRGDLPPPLSAENRRLRSGRRRSCWRQSRRWAAGLSRRRCPRRGPTKPSQRSASCRRQGLRRPPSPTNDSGRSRRRAVGCCTSSNSSSSNSNSATTHNSNRTDSCSSRSRRTAGCNILPAQVPPHRRQGQTLSAPWRKFCCPTTGRTRSRGRTSRWQTRVPSRRTRRRWAEWLTAATVATVAVPAHGARRSGRHSVVVLLLLLVLLLLVSQGQPPRCNRLPAEGREAAFRRTAAPATRTAGTSVPEYTNTKIWRLPQPPRQRRRPRDPVVAGGVPARRPRSCQSGRPRQPGCR